MNNCSNFKSFVTENEALSFLVQVVFNLAVQPNEEVDLLAKQGVIRANSFVGISFSCFVLVLIFFFVVVVWGLVQGFCIFHSCCASLYCSFSLQLKYRFYQK